MSSWISFPFSVTSLVFLCGASDPLLLMVFVTIRKYDHRPMSGKHLGELEIRNDLGGSFVSPAQLFNI